MSNWYSVAANDNDIVVSTRVRLARNISNTPFPSYMNEEERVALNEKVKKAIVESDTPYAKSLKYISMSDIPENEIYAMVERHIISPDFAKNPKNRAIIISEDESICVMIGEEDHIRIQVIKAGLQLEKAYEIADSIDNLLASKLEFAYDSQLGFLTECPTNLGTGLRASVMLHLPLLSSGSLMAEMAETVGKIGFTVRGMYGEGSKSKASLYQISNQITLGITEKNAIENLSVIARQLMARETEERNSCDKVVLEDAVWRAYGILKNQRILSSDEMMKLVSKIKIGASMGILPIDSVLPIKILIETQPFMLCRKCGDKTPQERDILRAETVRELLR
ncbi:MAG: protein arginine kinase [Acutalibacteraceae bacterium]|nr:protein arginine kinase [Acutalibacteraceae bacterium]